MATAKNESNDIIAQVAERIEKSDNVLVALSKDPSVDELSAALGLTFLLDKIGKRTTAIFSGAIPNAIEFLEPEKTFEANTDSLQDFIIALDKDKADHLRYKIEGDYVKVFITPYRTTITEADLEFSHGDYNVDLVISLNVASVEDLDGALSEYARIKHDATSINITTDVEGTFGDLEWSDVLSSSVSEMVGVLAGKLKGKSKDEDLLDKSIATAILAGIVAATNRFSNERTTPETMALASKLMIAGADQQLISSSIPVEILTKDIVDATGDLQAAEASMATDQIPAPEASIPIDQNPAPEAQPEPVPPVNPEAPAQPIEQPIEQPVAPASEQPIEQPAPAEPQDEFADIDIQHGGAVDFGALNEAPAEATVPPVTSANSGEVKAEVDAIVQNSPLSSLISGVKGEGEAAADPTPSQSELASAAATPSITTGEPAPQNAETELQNGLEAMSGAQDLPSDLQAELEAESKRQLENRRTKIMPLGEVMNRVDEQKDYAAMMAAELSGNPAAMPQPAPAPVAAPAMPVAPTAPMAPPIPDNPTAPVVPPAEAIAPEVVPGVSPVPENIQPVDFSAVPEAQPIVSAPVATPLDNVDAAVFVDPATVASDAPVLPPPPTPSVDISGFMPPAEGGEIPAMPTIPMEVPTEDQLAGISAAQIADGIQATNPAVGNTEALGGEIEMPAVAMAPVAMDPAAVAAEPVAAPAAEAAPAPAPAEDPGAFRIPGM